MDPDTPAPVVDLEIMGRYIETLRSYFRQSATKVRPYVSCHQCPSPALFQNPDDLLLTEPAAFHVESS